jgi:UDP-N-acetylmuramoyl-tripeptide--D-alanyl-D-alanine ligase
VRERAPEHLVAITGSAGKTTTKEFLVRLLARRYRVAGSPGNLNNLYGFPVALLGIPDDTQWMVAEMAMSTPGELLGVSLLGRPDAVVLTNVRPVHLAGFEQGGAPASLRSIALAKAEVLQGLRHAGTIVANGADPEVVWIVRRHLRERDPEVRVVWYGVRTNGAAVAGARSARAWQVEARALHKHSAPPFGTRFELRTRGLGRPGATTAIELPVHGAVNVENFVAAAACALALGVSLAEIAAGASDLEAQPGRGRVERLRAGALLVDDSYNANPDATARALRAAAELPGKRRFCVLGEMLELGAAAGEHHRAIGELAADLGFAPVIGVGPLAREIVAAAAAAGAPVAWFERAASAAEAAASEARAGDVVLVKGSRGVALETVVRALRDAASSGGP